MCALIKRQLDVIRADGSYRPCCCGRAVCEQLPQVLSFGPAEVGTGRGVTFSMGAVTLLITSGQKVLFLFRVCSTAVQVCTAQGKQGWQDLPSSHSAAGGRGTQKQVIPRKKRGSSGRERACNVPLLCSSVGFDLKTPGSRFVPPPQAGHLEWSAQRPPARGAPAAHSCLKIVGHKVPVGLPGCSSGQAWDS